MNESQRDYIKQIIGDMQCPKEFTCAKSGFEKLCKVRDIGMKSLLECVEANPEKCKFSIPFDHGHFCRCPLRVYLEKNTT